MLLYLVKQVELAARARLDDIFRPIGLTALQYTALTVLERHDNMSSAQLARHSFVTAQSMADMVAALEARALIERNRDDADRRRLVVALTGQGRALLDRYRDEVRELEEGMLAGLSEAEMAALRVILDRCHANLASRPGRPAVPGPAGDLDMITDPGKTMGLSKTTDPGKTTHLGKAAGHAEATDRGGAPNPGTVAGAR
jgi:DNA-binding MarR family transcriptional regulator